MRESKILRDKRVVDNLDQELLDLELDGQDLGLEIRTLVGGDGASNNGAGDTAGTAESGLGGDENVGDVLVLAKKRQVQENLNGLGVGGHDDELGDTTVEGLGGLVSTLLELLVVGGLLDKVEDLSSELVVGQREGFGVGGLFEKKKNEEKKEKEKKVKERNHLEPRENQEEIAKVVLTILF